VSALGLYVLEQNKKSLPPVAQALLGGRLVHVLGSAMYPTLKDGDIVTFDTRAYLSHAPQRGDIVLFIPPDAASRLGIKRVIAIPGDRLLIVNGVVQINGVVLKEPYLAGAWTYNNSWPASGQATLVPAGQYFMMGDNRNQSSDSRTFGFVGRDEILGKLIR
jgi:signal peptidase I